MKTQIYCLCTLLAVSAQAASTINRRVADCTDGEEVVEPKSGKTFVLQCGKSSNGELIKQQGFPGNPPMARNATVCVGGCGRVASCKVAQWDSTTRRCTLLSSYGEPSPNENVVVALLREASPNTSGNSSDAADTLAPSSTIDTYASSPTTWVTVTESKDVTSTRTHTVVASGSSILPPIAAPSSQSTPAAVFITVTVPYNTSSITMPSSRVSEVPTSLTTSESSFAPSKISSTTTSATPTSSSSSSSSSTTSTTSSSALPASSSAAPVSKPQGKRGLLYTDAAFTKNFGGPDSKVTWASNWAYDRYLNDKQQRVSVGQFNDALEFVPQLWNVSTGKAFEGYMGGGKAASKGTAGDAEHLLAFNEPNQCDGGGTCMLGKVDLLVESYKKMLQPYGKTARLGSPSVTNGVDGIPYLQEFMQKCSDCQIDYVQAHWYGGPNDLEDYLESFHKAFPDKPIWLTEFALTPDMKPSQTEEIDFLKKAMEFLDKTDYIERYAFFMAAPMKVPGSQEGDPRSLVNPDGSLTELGKLYNSG